MTATNDGDYVLGEDNLRIIASRQVMRCAGSHLSVGHDWQER
jgi:hypothetical protein